MIIIWSDSKHKRLPCSVWNVLRHRKGEEREVSLLKLICCSKETHITLKLDANRLQKHNKIHKENRKIQSLWSKQDIQVLSSDRQENLSNREQDTQLGKQKDCVIILIWVIAPDTTNVAQLLPQIGRQLSLKSCSHLYSIRILALWRGPVSSRHEAG